MIQKLLRVILNICYILPYVLLAAPIAVYLFLLLNGNFSWMFKGLPLFISLVLVSIILIINRKSIFSGDLKLCSEVYLSEKFSPQWLLKIFGILFSAAFVWILVTDTRDAIFLLFIIALYSLIVLQIFAKESGKRFTPLILLELMAVFVLQVFSTLFTHAYYYGWTDVPVHLNWIQTIVESGHVESILGQYTNYCLFHIDSVMASLLSGLDTYTTLYLTATPLIIVSTVFIYHIAKHFTKSSQLPLLASFFYVMIPVIIQYAVYPMPRMHSTIAFIIILYGMFRWGKEFKFSHLLLVLFVMLYMVLVHHAQLIPVALMMTGIFVFLLIYRYRFTLLQKLTLGFFYLVSAVGLLVGPYGAPWVSKYLEKILQSVPSTPVINPSNPGTDIPQVAVPSTPVIPGDVPGSVVEEVIESGGSSGSVFAQTSAAESLDAWNQVLIGEFGVSAWFSLISTAMMIVFILFGIYYLLSPKMMNKKIAVFGMFGIVLTLVFAPHVAEIVESWLSTDLELDRLRLVMSPVYAVIMAVGCAVIANLVSSMKNDNGRKRGVPVAILLCIALIVASPIMAESRDSTAFDGLMIADTDYFTETEMVALNSLEEYIPAGSSIYTDQPVMRYYPGSKGYLNYDMAYFSFKNGGDKLYSENVDVPHLVEYVIVRDDRYELSGLWYADSNGKSVRITPTDENTLVLFENVVMMAKVYSSESIWVVH
ncbi:MAG: hypothetical protein E7Z72_02675 [Methanocorpusculum parvum]|nr:hypothetical protein [Methanocorpusculum parvum]